MRCTKLLGIATIVATAILMAAGCSSTNVNDLPGPTREVAKFELSVLPESFIDNSSVDELALETEDLGDGLMVHVRAAGADRLRALYFDMTYDADAYRPMIGIPSEAMDDSSQILKFQYFKEPGVVHYGQAVIDPLSKPGFTGDGIVASILFKKEEALNTRFSSKANTGTNSAQLVNPDVTANLTWWYASEGDYDQNSEVNQADLTEIVLNYLESGPWDDQYYENVVDGDGNTEINAADITQIATNFGAATTQFSIHSSANIADYPDGGTEVLTVAHNTGVADPDGKRLLYTVPMNDPGFGNLDPMNFYWIYPSDGTANGTVSNWVGGDQTDFPTLDLTNPPLNGDGSQANPYIVFTLTDYIFSLTDPTDGDVSTNPNTTYFVSNAAAGSISNVDATLNIPDTFEGNFNVSAEYNGTPNQAGTTVYLRVEPATQTGLYILPDPADNDWTSVTGTGVDGDNPYVLGEAGGYNDTYAVEFSMVANTVADGSGDAIDVNDLTWMAVPPFVVDWVSAGTLKANLFTSEYFFAQDADTNNSNNVYVVHHSLPTD